MSENSILKSYIPIVDFIANVCGPSYEVVLHDVSKPDSSVIAIRNGYITGRKIGSPLTDLALKILKQKEYLNKDFISNYKGYGNDGKIFLSSTYFIKNANNKLIGLICVNNNITDLISFKNNYEKFLERFDFIEEKQKEENYEEFIENPVTSLANSIISRTINSLNVSPDRLSIEEKVKIVHELNNKGVFLLKGSVSEIAQQLQISETTVYRYLNKKTNH